jgi:ketopantoate reductase
VHVAVVGAGALGSVYGAHLALRGGCEVSVVGRAAGRAPPVRLERADDGEVLAWAPADKVARVPPGADVVLLCVRYELLDDAAGRAAGGGAPVVVMTPMMPQDHARLARALPGRVRAAMPSVVAYATEAGVIRYWLPRVATTLIEPGEPPGAEQELARRLERAGIRARLHAGVLERDVATTVSFIPLAMALDAAGGIDALLGDEALLSLAFAAADEGRELGRAVGKAEAWASTLLRFVGPRVLKVGIGVARSRAPEVVRYVEEHFGRKLRAQNALMAERMVQLAREKGTPHGALEALRNRLVA